MSKPSGWLVHNSAWSGPREVSLLQRLRATVGGALHPVHRLDRGASGLVLFARSPEAARAWQQAWQSPDLAKRYVAVVRGRLLEATTVDHPIRDQRTGGSQERARPARSVITPLAVSPVERCSLVQVLLVTGRRHQARRHLKHLSHPIVGDTTWGKGDVNRHFRETYALNRLALHAGSLEITHPQTGERLDLQAPLPQDLARVVSQLFPDGRGTEHEFENSRSPVF
ncbi:MAG: pseudouridine synthase [bacterium]